MRKAVWVVLAALLAGCASDPSDVVATGSSTTGSAASDQPVVTSEAAPPSFVRPVEPTTGCVGGDRVAPEGPPGDGWLDEARLEEQHPIGIDGGNAFADVAGGTDLDDQIRTAREAVFAWTDALFPDVVRGTAEVRVRCLTDNLFIDYFDVFFVLGNDDGETLEVQIIDRLTGGFPYFTTPSGDLSFESRDGYDVLINDYAASRQEAWVIDEAGVALMLRVKGADAPNLAGWPTTFPPPIDAPDPQPAPAEAEDLVEAALEIHQRLYPA